MTMLNDLSQKARALATHTRDEGLKVTRGAAQQATDKFQNLMVTHYPTVEPWILARLMDFTEQTLLDEHQVRSVLEKAYEMLPLPARLILPRARFVDHMMTQRTALASQVQQLRGKASAIEARAPHEKGLSDERPVR
jgi:hypothetical protein